MTTFAPTDLGAFGSLTTALGITTGSGTNASWFTDPVGGSADNRNGLKTIVSDDAQRTALIDFVDDVLGPPQAETDDETTWLPLFRSPAPALTVYAVLTPVTGAVHLGVGLSHSTGDTGPRVTTRIHAPLFRVPRGSGTLPTDSTSLPAWLLLGRQPGRISLEVDATFSDDPAVPGEAALRGLRAGVEIPTDGVSDVGFTLTLRDLQLPGATAPSSPTLDVDSLDELGEDVFDFAIGLLRAQLAALDTSDPGLRIAAAIGGLLGLSEDMAEFAFPFAELPSRGADAITEWVKDVLEDEEARDLWLGHLARLTGGTARPAQDAVEFSIGAADLLLGIRVTPGTAGHLVLLPWLRLDLEASPGAVVSLTADLLRADTATGTVTALPSLDLSAVFGSDAPAPKLLATGPVRIRSLRVGIGIDASRHPAPRLTLHDVDLAAGTPNATHHDLLDLSSPDAALAAVDDVVSTLLTRLLEDLGDAGSLLAAALGVAPPTGVDPISVTALLADPLGELAAYWRRLVTEATGTKAVLGDLAHLLTGSTPTISGLGTEAVPWLLPLHDSAPVGLAVTAVADRLTVALSAQPAHALSGTPLGDLEVSAALRVALLNVDLSTGATSFLTAITGGLRLESAGPDPLRLQLPLVDLTVTGCGLDLSWRPGGGVLLTPTGALALAWHDGAAQHALELPLPTRAADGSLVLTADWGDVELALGRLLLAPELAAVHPFVQLLGWTGTGPRLALAALITDPVPALESWAADLALECTHQHTVLSAVATVLSAGAVRAPFGSGRRGAPHRLPVGGHPRLPGLAVWSDPPCPRPPEWGETAGFDPGQAPGGVGLVAALEAVADGHPDLADLLFGRSALAAGLDALVTRCTATDGLVGATAGLPLGVTSSVLTGYGHAEARAASVLSPIPYLQMGAAPATRVHVTTDRDWWLGQTAAARVDATGPLAAIPALPPSDTGRWFVLVPPTSSAGEPAADGVAAQADRLAAVLRARTTPVTLVADGGPGAAALRAAARPALAAAIGAVVTVGTPWTAVPLATFVGHGGAALAFLTALAGSDLPQLPDDQLAHFSDALQRSFGLLRRVAQERQAADLPSAAGEAIRPGLVVHAVFGSLTETDATAQIAALMAYAVEHRQLEPVTSEPVTSELVHDLHVGVGLPALDVALGAISLGVGADLSLLSVHRDEPRLRTEQVLTAAVRLGVTDGWLVGGPGASQRDLEVRWVEVVLHVPLDGTDATCELVLHEARAFTAYRERWVVRVDDLDPSATLALPEVKLILGAVAERIEDEAATLADLLRAYGLFRDGGLDPTGLDRLLFDTRAFLRTPLTADPAGLVDLLRDLLGTPAGPAPTILRLGEGLAQLDVDLAAGSVTGTATTSIPGLAPVSASVTVTSTGATARLAVGDADGLLLRADLGAGGPSVALDLAGSAGAAGAAGARIVPLYPAFSDEHLLDLLRLTLPSVAGKALLDGLRTAVSASARATIDDVLGALGLLDPVLRTTQLPVGLLLDPVAWLRDQADPLTALTAVLDAAADLIWPDRTDPGWPITDDVRISYALVADRLDLLAHVALTSTVDSATVALALAGGVRIGLSGPSAALLTAHIVVDGYGAALRVGASPATPVALDLLRPTPAPPLAIYPLGPGLASGVEIAGAAAQAAVVVALNELIARRGDGTSAIQRVGMVADQLAIGLGLVADPSGTDHSLDPGQVGEFARDPGARLLTRVPSVAAHGLAAIATALGSTEITARTDGPRTRLAYAGAGSSGSADSAYLELDGATQEVVLGARVDLGGVGVLDIEQVRIGAAGVQVAVTVGPVIVDLGTVRLFPVVSLRAGVSPSSFARMVGLGLATSATGAESVQVRWALDATPPQLLAITGGAPSTDVATIVSRALGIAVSIASGVLAEQLASVLSAEVTAKLQGVVFTGGTATIDPGFVTALLDPDALLARLYTLVWNCAAVGTPISVTIEDLLVIGLTAVTTPEGWQHLGLRISIPDRQQITLVEGSLTVALECDASWIVADVDAGISILVLAGPNPAALQLRPGVVVAGIGVRFTSHGQPLIDLDGFSIDGIAVRIYGEASSAGVGGGAQLVLDGLSVAPGGGGGSNPVANGIMNDVGSSSGSARPTFSPAIAVQKPPGSGVAVSLRAGDPPGPWWLVIQRQLGPLYVDRIGLDAVENGGRVTRISLLFTGQLELFGLTAAVDQLSLSWNGGDVLAISSWSVDLMGLAISADMAGVSISGGLLKIVEGSSTSYIGMLVGRFAAYGLSVFGGFTQDGSNASFFVFGGFNGPIGGPPAFFLTGIAGGLGINRGLRVPDDLSQFGRYPFIRVLNPAEPVGTPMEELRKLAEYFPHQVGNFWFAGGVSFTCFSLIDGIAVLAVSFGSSGLDITLFGLARMALPRPGAALVSIELAILVRFSMSEGVFMIRAQLTDNSWLLYPDIRLTGGFAFAIWWKGPLAGQFVLTMGGYHPSFHVDGYPDVPRLGLVWRISDYLVIKGGSYFALTSEALMAGQSVEASLDLGWVWAKVSFGADGIVYFDPFSFDVRAYARISAGIHIDLWLTTISLSITLGAEIHVWGPDFAGEVTFEIGPATVPIRFGSQRRVAPQTLAWSDFVAKYLEQGSGSAARALSSITGRGTLPTSTKGGVGAPSADGSAALPFRVFAEFEITFTTSIPVTAIVVGSVTRGVTPTLAGAASSLGLAPMGLRDLTPTLRIDVQKTSAGAWEDRAAAVASLADGLGAGSQGPAALATTAFPLGVFGAPNNSATANTSLPSHEVVVAASQVTLVATADLPPPGPEMDYYRVTATRRPLPLHATRTSRASMINVGKTLAVAPPASAAAALAQAQTLLFDHGAEPHSALARAAFTTGRAAPPLFGTLTDGLGADNGPRGTGDRLPVTAEAARRPRRPVVTAFLEAGDGADRRPAGTTVGDGRLKRRSAPSLDSARSRLTRRLPVSLELTTPSVAATPGTVAVTAAAPRTASATTGAAFHGGLFTAAPLQGLVTGLGPKAGLAPRSGPGRPQSRAARARADEIAQSIHGGDVVVLQCLDARYDGDVAHRPHLAITGACRVLALTGRSIVADLETDGRPGEQQVAVPPGSTLLAVHAGGDLDLESGYPGWHDGARIARLGERVGLAAGCALSVERSAAAEDRTVAWQPAHALTGGASEILTRFSRPVRTVAIALTGSAGPVDPGTALSSTGLVLSGATLARSAGTDRAPVLVVLGSVSVLVYAVVPDEDSVSVSVSVTNGPTWNVTGVLGALDPPEVVAGRIAELGLPGVLARVTSAAGDATVGWLDARRTR